MNLFAVPISIFTIFYNFVASSWDFLTSPIAALSVLAEIFDILPDWISMIIGTHNIEVVIRYLSELSVIELVFGSSITFFLIYAFIKFLLPSS